MRQFLFERYFGIPQLNAKVDYCMLAIMLSSPIWRGTAIIKKGNSQSPLVFTIESEI